MLNAGRLPGNSLVCAIALASLLLLVVARSAVAAPGDVDTPYDGHDTVSATATPYASTAPFSTTLSYASSEFTTAAVERDDNGLSDDVYTNKTGCADAPPDWGGRSGWVRFDAAVSGTLQVDVSTAGYDPFIIIWTAPSVPLGTTQFASMVNSGLCNSVRADTAESQGSIPVLANRAIHIQTLGYCGSGAYWTSTAGCTDAGGDPDTILDRSSPGGQTSVSLSFQCHNGDGDAACDTLDACPAVPGPQDGCPDRDRDGFLDDADRCPDVAGPDLGCPADQDNDGIPNGSDQCVTQQGYAPSGCPDGDADSVFFPADSCPTEKGIATDGCPDSDGDGVSDRTDACKSVYGASSTGCLAVLGAAIRWDFTRTFRLRRLRVQTLPGAKIELRCSARRKLNCPISRKTYTASTKARDFKSLFRNRSLLRRPFILVFRVTKRGYLGTYKRYTYDGRAAPRTLDRCILPMGRVQRCPR